MTSWKRAIFRGSRANAFFTLAMKASSWLVPSVGEADGAAVPAVVLPLRGGLLLASFAHDSPDF